jgi:MerR family transcriptional regulator, light-induced transcriptional regulator
MGTEETKEIIETTETTYLSTVQVARMVGVSPTTIKRWVDDGVLPAHRTAGGHRKLLLADVQRVTRDRGLPQAEIGLTAIEGSTECEPGRIRESLIEAMSKVDCNLIRAILRDAQRNGLSIATIADDIVSPCMQWVGSNWQHGRMEVSEEHLITQTLLGVFYEFRAVAIPTLATENPIAIGGAPEHDHYILPSLLAQLTLLESGWQAVNVGPHTPMSAFLHLLQTWKPKLIWLSVSHIENKERFELEYRYLYQAAQSCGIPISLGGRALTEELRSRLPYTTYGDRLEQLAAFANTLKPPPTRPKRGRPRLHS